jgi:hypothetical protein
VSWPLGVAGALLSIMLSAPPARRSGPTRIDFDDRLIQGQTNTSGAVYLLERKETTIKSLVRPRLSFRHLTIRTVYDR